MYFREKCATFLIGFLFLTSCGEAPQIVPQNPQNGDDATASKIDVSKATISLVRDAGISQPSAQSLNLSVPNFAIHYNVADHMQVLRCQKNYNMTLPNGMDAREALQNAVSASEGLKFAWTNAVGSTADCVLLSNRISREDFFDLAAKSGDFYYILNPCVDAARLGVVQGSVSQQCSYNLVFTQSISFLNSLSTEVVAAAQKLNQAEGSFTALFTQMQSLAQSIKSQSESCLKEQLVDAARSTAFDAVANLVSMAIPQVSNTIIGGALSSILGVTNVFDLAKKFVIGDSSSAQKCPVASNLQTQFTQISKSVDGALQMVLSIRNELNQLNGIGEQLTINQKEQ